MACHRRQHLQVRVKFVLLKPVHTVAEK